MLRQIAIIGAALILTATLLWGNCLSCIYDLVTAPASNELCCHVADKCKKSSPDSRSAQQCRLQPAAVNNSAEWQQPVKRSACFLTLPCDKIFFVTFSKINSQAKPSFIPLGSPPSPRLLNSVFQI